MTDTMTPEQRHRCMSHIRSKATKPEMKVRRWLGLGFGQMMPIISLMSDMLWRWQ